MPSDPNPDCESCKDNKWWVKNGPVRARENERLTLEIKRLLARVAYLEWQQEHERWSKRDEESWNQIKLRRQEKVITQLQEKLTKREAKTVDLAKVPDVEPPWGYVLKLANTEQTPENMAIAPQLWGTAKSEAARLRWESDGHGA